VIPTVRGSEAARETSDVDVDQQLLSELAGGDILPVVVLPDVPIPDVPHPRACPDGCVGDELTSPGVGEEGMVVAFRLRSGS